MLVPGNKIDLRFQVDKSKIIIRLMLAPYLTLLRSEEEENKIALR